MSEAKVSIDYTTSDISLAAFLYASGVELTEVDARSFPSKFLFGRSDGKLENLVLSFQDGSANCNAPAYYRAYRHLIARIKEGSSEISGGQ